jgi:hypothetical protein
VLQVGEKPRIRIRERWRACLEATHNLGRVLTANNVQPFLYIALVRELGSLSLTRRGKELVQVELVELPGAGDGQQLFRHLVGKQTHLRQRTVRVPLAGVLSGKLFLGTLFVGVSPVEYLLFDELAGGERFKRCVPER